MKLVILAGGSGSRLWPLSRDEYPKQLLVFEKDDSMEYGMKIDSILKDLNKKWDFWDGLKNLIFVIKI